MEKLLPPIMWASNADIVHTYKYLLRASRPATTAARKLERSDHSMSLFLVHFGVRGEYKQLAHHTILFGPRYKELLTDIFDRGVLAEDFSLYLHSPSVTDSSMAPPGHSTHYALAPVPNLELGKVDWSSAGPLLRDRILDCLEQRCMPGLRENIVTSRLFMPPDFERGPKRLARIGLFSPAHSYPKCMVLGCTIGTRRFMDSILSGPALIRERAFRVS